MQKLWILLSAFFLFSVSSLQAEEIVSENAAAEKTAVETPVSEEAAAESEVSENSADESTPEIPAANGAMVIDNTDQPDKNEPIEFVDTEETVEIDPALPTCDDSILLAKVWMNSKSFMAANPGTSVLEKRNEALISRNLDKFKEIDAGKITARDDFEVASRVVMIKINNGLDNSLLRLCKSTSEGITSNVYILLYREYGETIVEVMNLVPLSAGEKSFTFKY